MKLKIPFITSDKEVDPVCDMKVDKDNPPGGTAMHDGQVFYFCGPGCKTAFQKDPDAYVRGEKKMQM